MQDWGRFTPWRTREDDVNAAEDRVHQWWFRFPNDLGLSVMEFPQRPGFFDVLPSRWSDDLRAADGGPAVTHWGDEQVRLTAADVLTILTATEQLDEAAELPYLEPEATTWY